MPLAEFQHVKPGKGAAFVRSKLKNQITGNTVERTFRAGEMVGTADVSKSEAQFTYNEGKDVRAPAPPFRLYLHVQTHPLLSPQSCLHAAGVPPHLLFPRASEA